ncbi:MAG: hypothetical protein WCT49_00145 [Candidatus Paceibacterota bacterium]|jgi:hypothetical protein|nr:hypothetical protein [Candidatus Paceibacterota bacterium]
MKRKKSYFTFFTCLSIFFPTFAFARGYKLLAPIPTTSAAPSAVEYLKGVFVAGVGLAIIAAVIMIIVGALGYVTAAVPSAKAEGKKKMGEAIFGLLILLISTVIIVTINPDLMRTGLNLVKLAPTSVTQQQQQTATQYCRTGVLNNACYSTLAECEGPQRSYTCTTNPPPQTQTGTQQSTGNEQANRSLLTDTGHITVNAQPPQTILAGVNESTLHEVLNLQQQSGADIVVTAGSEPGHADGTYSHANGYKVDLRTTSSVSNYIMDNYTNIGRRSDGALQYQSPSGAIYAMESDHWDVLVK